MKSLFSRTMNGGRDLVLKDLVLVGGGHSHVIVLKRLGMNPMPGLRVTMIARDIHTPYSGMLPGFVAGHYNFDDIHIDLAPLAQFAGARLYHDEVVGLDLANRKVFCRDRPAVSYDILSIDIGSTPSLTATGSAEHALAIKPIVTLIERLEGLKTRVLTSSYPFKVGVVGAGAAGVELTLAVQFAVRQLLSQRGLLGNEPKFHLFSAAQSILPTHNRLVRKKFERVLRTRGVHIHTEARVTALEAGALSVNDGSDRFEFDEIMWATEAGAQQWPADSGLDVDRQGFICVEDTLQSTSNPEVFASGDISSMVHYPHEKAGVFAVRQGPRLEVNLRRVLQRKPLKPFKPQRNFLSLVSTGDQYVIASRGSWSLAGRWLWQLKNRIDRRFVRQFNNLPTMVQDVTNPSSFKALAPTDVLFDLSKVTMRCGGCGSKVGSALLDKVLARLSTIRRGDVLVGLETLDDASVEQVPSGFAAVRTIDGFRAIVDDPYTFGQITTIHCLGDIHAMGAEPQTALAIVTLPLSTEAKMESLLEEILTGTVNVLNAAGTALVGGHTTEGNELFLGLALSGIVEPTQMLRKSGMKPGNLLILTKPLGIGTIFAAHMQLKAKGRWIDAAMQSMLQSSSAASQCLRRHGATACTDVTGFGLVGHLGEMVRASKVDAHLDLSAVPLLDGSQETIAGGWLSSLHPQNFRLRSTIANIEEIASSPIYPIIFDPQTAGGLLASVPAERANTCVTELHGLGYIHTSIIGVVEPLSDRDASIRIKVSGGVT